MILPPLVFVVSAIDFTLSVISTLESMLMSYSRIVDEAATVKRTRAILTTLYYLSIGNLMDTKSMRYVTLEWKASEKHYSLFAKIVG